MLRNLHNYFDMADYDLDYSFRLHVYNPKSHLFTCKERIIALQNLIVGNKFKKYIVEEKIHE